MWICSFRLRSIRLSLPAGAAGDVNGDGIGDFGVMGTRPSFNGSALVIYFGCNGCDRALIAAPDAVVEADGGRLFGFVGNAGNFNQRGVDPRPSTIFFSVGRCLLRRRIKQLFVVAGRQNWPALPASLNVNDDPAQNPAGVTVLSIPDIRAGYAGAGIEDQNNDGVDEHVFSAGNPSVVYRFNGGADVANLFLRRSRCKHRDHRGCLFC